MLLASFLHIERGNFRAAHGLVQQLSDIGEIYENNFCRAVKYLVSGTLFVGYRKLHDAMNEVEKGIFFIERTNLKVWLILMVSLKARIQILLGNINGSKDSFEYAEKVMFEIAEVPMYRAYLTVSKFLYKLHKLEEARREADKDSTKKYRAKAISAGKESLKMANKYSFTKTETLKLMGAYYWIIEKQRKAMKWWHKAIQEGRRMNYRLELSRTYFEVGRRLLEPKSRYKELDGVKAEEYLEKAKVMFEEMDLQWDLDELEKFKMHIGS